MNAVVLVFLVILVVLAGAVLLGMSLGKTDALNPYQGPAIAENLRAQTEAFKADMARELAHRMRMDALIERAYDAFITGGLIVMGLLTAMFGLGRTYCLFAWGHTFNTRETRRLIEAENEHLKLLSLTGLAPSPPASHSALAAPPNTLNGSPPPSQRRWP